MEAESKRHILALPFPAQGHMTPMYHLCNRLASNGFFITFLVALKKENFIAPKNTPANFRFVYLPEEFVQQVFTLSNSALGFLQVFESNLGIVLPNIVQDIMKDGPAPQLVCILTDELITLHDITTRFGLCKAALSTFPASHLCLRRGTLLLQAKGMLPLKESDDMVDFIPGVPLLRTNDFPAHFKVVDPLDTDLKVRQRKCELSKENAWVLMNTFHELEDAQLEQIARETPQYVAVGPVLPPFAFAQTNGSNGREDDGGGSPGLWSEDTECLSWLDEQPVKSVVYISFGSLAVVSEDQIREIVEGLEQAGTRFLWVMRSDMMGDGKLAQVFKESKQGKVVSWAPQLKVLKHASVAAFLTHCGWNSILEAVTTGVPVLCWPSSLYEQPLNCALAVDHWKIGFRMSPNPGSYVPAKDVASSVRDIMGEPGSECRKNVATLSTAARNGLSTGRSQKNFQAFMHDVLTGYPKPAVTR